MTQTMNLQINRVTESRLASTDFNNLPFGRVFSDHMLAVDYKDGQWQNARIIPFGNIEVTPALTCLHYAQACFEGMKANQDVHTGDVLLFRPRENAKRLNASAIRLGMPSFPEDLFINYLKELIQLDKNWIPDMEDSALYIRPVLFGSDDFIGVRPSETYRLYIIIGPTGPYYGKPVRVKIEEKYVRAFRGGTGDVKAAGNYAATLHPALLAKKEGFDQILWTDGLSHEYVEEIGTMNVFFIVDGKVWTPALSGSILPGITRDSIMQLFKDSGFEVEERKISVQEIINAHQAGKLEDAFGVGTAATVTHIAELGYRGQIFTLPALETRTASFTIKEELIGIKTGRIADRHGWIDRVS